MRDFVDEPTDRRPTPWAPARLVLCMRCGCELQAGARRCSGCGSARVGLGAAIEPPSHPLLTQSLIGLAGVALVLAWIRPEALGAVQLGGVEAWLRESPAHRALAILPLGMLLLTGHRMRRRIIRRAADAAWAALAAEASGEFHQVPRTSKAGRGEGGPQVRIAGARPSLVLDGGGGGAASFLRFRASVALRRSFHFCLIRLGGERRTVWSPLWGRLSGFGLESTGGHRPAGAPGHARGDGPVEIGGTALDGDFILRSDDPAAARALFMRPGVMAAARELRTVADRWQLTLSPSRDGETAVLEFREPGGVPHLGRLHAIQDLFAAVLDPLPEGRFVIDEPLDRAA